MRGAFFTPGLLAALLVVASCAKEDRSGLVRRAIGVPGQSGWARVRLDGDAQRAAETLWIGDARGTSIPFIREREGLWAPQTLATSDYLAGKDGQGHPTAEFALRFPDGWKVREREHLRMDLELEGDSPWVCRVDVSRRMENGGFLTLERDAPFFVFDLGNARSTREITLPWDADRYRVTLVPTQGEAPKLRGLRVTACTWPEALEADEVLTPREVVRDPDARKQPGESWIVALPGTQRVVALDVVLVPPVAPVTLAIEIPRQPGERVGRSPGSGTVWNLPALDTRATRIALEPVVTDRLRLTLPEGARLDSVKVLIRREVLLFPAEAGKSYVLHVGGGVKQAPGNLGALPSSRLVYGRAPLSLAAPEPDPEGIAVVIEGGERTRPWLPYAVGVVVLVLGFFAFKLLKGGPGEVSS